MKAKIHISPTRELLVHALSASFKEAVDEAASKSISLHIAIPGGSTPQKFYQYLSGPIANEINWNFVHFYWGDERCVPPDHPESNYGMAADALLNKIAIPKTNIHRSHGEDTPNKEVKRYTAEMEKNIPLNDQQLPQFDWILLGLGTDGHTASLFPHLNLPQDSTDICITATHPETRQNRISLNLPVINSAKRVTFLVTGSSKSTIVDSIVEERSDSFPAAKVFPPDGILEWYLDQNAASQL